MVEKLRKHYWLLRVGILVLFVFLLFFMQSVTKAEEVSIDDDFTDLILERVTVDPESVEIALDSPEYVPLTFTAHYEGGATEEIYLYEHVDFWPNDDSIAYLDDGILFGESVGETTIGFIFEGQETTLAVKVVDPDASESVLEDFTVAPESFEVELGRPEFAELAFTAHYSDGRTEDLFLYVDVDFEIEDPEIANYDDGVIFGEAVGETTMFFFYEDYEATMSVKVVDPDAPEPTLEGIQFNQELHRVSVEGTTEASVYAIASDGQEGQITDGVIYHVADDTIATVDDDGIVTGISSGVTTLEAEYAGKAAEVVIYVHDEIFLFSGGDRFDFIGGNISIPEGAVSEAFNIFVDIVRNTDSLPLGDDQQLLSTVFDLTKDFDGNFDEEITLIFSFDAEQVNDEDYDIALFWLNEETDEWEQLNNITVDWEEGIVSGTVDHFTKFAVLSTQTQAEEDDDEEENGDDASTGADSDKTDEEGKELPKTASSTYNLLLIGGLVLLTGSILYYVNYRRKEKHEN